MNFLFKFQSNLFFVNNFYKNLLALFRLIEPSRDLSQSESSSQIQGYQRPKFRDDSESDSSDSWGTDEREFETFVQTRLAFDVKMNLHLIKKCAFGYFLRILEIFEQVGVSLSRISKSILKSTLT